MPIANLPDGTYEVRIFMDWSSVEIFINGGQYVMTAQLFPNLNYTDLIIDNTASEALIVQQFEVSTVNRIW